jgi:hypothetical protein
MVSEKFAPELPGLVDYVARLELDPKSASRSLRFEKSFGIQAKTRSQKINNFPSSNLYEALFKKLKGETQNVRPSS